VIIIMHLALLVYMLAITAPWQTNPTKPSSTAGLVPREEKISYTYG